MYRHIVLLWLKNCSPDNLDAACTAIRGLAGHIPGLLSIEVEPDTLALEGACHLCVNLLFTSKEALDAFARQNAMRDVLSGLEILWERSYAVQYPVHRPARQMPTLFSYLGPSNQDDDMLRALLHAGMGGVRISLLHQSVSQVLPILSTLRKEANALRITPEILLDAQPDIPFLSNLRKLACTGVMLALPREENQLYALRRQLGPDVRLLAKIESEADLDALPLFLRHADEIVLFRSAMCRLLPHMSLAAAHRQVAALCHAQAKPFMVAGELLSSMRDRHYATAAEYLDIDTAVRSGARALMLGQEAAIGKYPVEAMETLRQAAELACLPSPG